MLTHENVVSDAAGVVKVFEVRHCDKLFLLYGVSIGFNVESQSHVSSESLCGSSIWRVHLVPAAGSHVRESRTGKHASIIYNFPAIKVICHLHFECGCVLDGVIWCWGKSRLLSGWYHTSPRWHENTTAHRISGGPTSAESHLWQGTVWKLLINWISIFNK